MLLFLLVFGGGVVGLLVFFGGGVLIFLFYFVVCFFFLWQPRKLNGVVLQNQWTYPDCEEYCKVEFNSNYFV